MCWHLLRSESCPCIEFEPHDWVSHGKKWNYTESSELATLATKGYFRWQLHAGEKRKVCFKKLREIEPDRSEVKSSLAKPECRSMLGKTILRRSNSWCWHPLHSKITVKESSISLPSLTLKKCFKGKKYMNFKVCLYRHPFNYESHPYWKIGYFCILRLFFMVSFNIIQVVILHFSFWEHNRNLYISCEAEF